GGTGVSAGAGSMPERVIDRRPMADSPACSAEASLPTATATPETPGGCQAGLSCLASWLVIVALRGLAASYTGMARVNYASPPAVKCLSRECIIFCHGEFGSLPDAVQRRAEPERGCKAHGEGGR